MNFQPGLSADAVYDLTSYHIHNHLMNYNHPNTIGLKKPKGFQVKYMGITGNLVKTYNHLYQPLSCQTKPNLIPNDHSFSFLYGLPKAGLPNQT